MIGAEPPEQGDEPSQSAEPVKEQTTETPEQKTEQEHDSPDAPKNAEQPVVEDAVSADSETVLETPEPAEDAEVAEEAEAVEVTDITESAEVTEVTEAAEATDVTEATETADAADAEEPETAAEPVVRKSFAELGIPPALLSLLATQGIDAPTEVQEVSIPDAIAGTDLMVGAETGSGKTLAFLLPTLIRLSQAGPEARAVVLAPTRELAQQIAEVAKPLSEAVGVVTRLVMGGEDFRLQQRVLRHEGGLWVATPGRLAEQIEVKPDLLDNVAVLVLDEADRMLDMGFAEVVLSLASLCPPNRQSLLFSATLSGGAMRRVREAVLQQPKKLVLNDPRRAHSAIEHQLLTADDDKHKLALLAHLAKHHDGGCILAFCKSRERAQVFGDKLQQQGVRATSLHGELDTKQRQRAVRLLRESTVQVMVATDVAARGLDVAGVTLVINIDMPRRAHQYIHRVGRTGRAGATGQAVSLVDHTEWNLFVAIERYMGQRFRRRRIDTLKGSYTGPKKMKKSGKAAGTKKKKVKKAADKKKR